jgi:hypothetical protein
MRLRVWDYFMQNRESILTKRWRIKEAAIGVHDQSNSGQSSARSAVAVKRIAK